MHILEVNYSVRDIHKMLKTSIHGFGVSNATYS